MTWTEREWFILKLLKRRKAASGAAVFVDPVILRWLIQQSEGKTQADIDALLKEGDDK